MARPHGFVAAEFAHCYNYPAGKGYLRGDAEKCGRLYAQDLGVSGSKVLIPPLLKDGSLNAWVQVREFRGFWANFPASCDLSSPNPPYTPL